MPRASQTSPKSQAPGVPLIKRAYRVDEACASLGLGRSKLYQLIADGKLRSVRLAGRTVILATELDRFIAEAA